MGVGAAAWCCCMSLVLCLKAACLRPFVEMVGSSCCRRIASHSQLVLCSRSGNWLDTQPRLHSVSRAFILYVQWSTTKQQLTVAGAGNALVAQTTCQANMPDM